MKTKEFEQTYRKALWFAFFNKAVKLPAAFDVVSACMRLSFALSLSKRKYVTMRNMKMSPKQHSKEYHLYSSVSPTQNIQSIGINKPKGL